MNAAIPEKFIANKSDRALLTQMYEINPIRRFQCLPNHPVKGLYKSVEDVAYQFEAHDRSDRSMEKFYFYTGHAAGDHFLELTNKALPPLQSWETLAGTGAGLPAAPGTPGVAVPGATGAAAFHPFNAELLTLLGIFFFKYDFDPTKPSAQFFTDINANPNVPQTQVAHKLNAVLNAFGETSKSLVAWLTQEAAGKSVRPMAFNLVNAKLLAAGVTVPAILP